MSNPSKVMAQAKMDANSAFAERRAAGLPVRVAIVGVGEMGRRHVRVFAGLSGFEVVGVADASRAVADEVARTFGVNRLRDAAEAIARAEVVVVATPIAAHRSGVEAALDAGRHVLVEKPICATVADAERLVALARVRGSKLYVGHSERFNPAVRAVADLVPPGDVLALDFWREGPPRGARRSPELANERDEGVLLNLGVHDLDLIALFTGGPARLRRAEGDAGRALLTLQTPSGALARIRLDRNASERRRAFTLATATHLYEADLLAPRLLRTPRAGGVAEELPLDACEPLLAQAHALEAGLLGRTTAIATGLDGARALALAEHAAERTRTHETAREAGLPAAQAAVAEKL